MNWKLIFQLSLFGLIMAFATISLIPEKFEFVFWIAIFIFCAWVIAKRAGGRYFFYGFLTGVVNCFWISVVHFIFFQSYMANHLDMVKMNSGMPASLQVHPRLLTTLAGLFIGLISTIILGLFAFIASKIVKKDAAKAGA